MKKCYHMTSLGIMRTLTTTGLTPYVGDSVRLDKYSEPTIALSEGVQGIVAAYAKEIKLYNDLKADKKVNGVNLTESSLRKIKLSKDFEDYLDNEGILIVFDCQKAEIRGNFIEARTEDTIDPNDLKVCYLKNLETGEDYFDRDKIIKYLAGKIPVESMQYEGKDASEEKTEELQKLVAGFFNQFKQEINVYKYGDFELHEMFITDYVHKKVTQLNGKLSGQSIGHDTMDYLLDIEKIQAIEKQLDRDVMSLEVTKEADKVRTLNNN